MTDREALNMLLDSLETGVNLRQFCERDLPRVARHLDAEGDYYELLIAVLEDAAAKQDIDNMRIYKDTELVAKLEESRESRFMGRPPCRPLFFCAVNRFLNKAKSCVYPKNMVI